MTAVSRSQLAKATAATLLAFLVVDGVWLGFIMTETYRGWLNGHMLATPRYAPAALFYVLYTTGVMVFAVLPALREQSLAKAAKLGALLGLVAYGTYDLSNYATLDFWPLPMTVVDIVWGGVLSCIAACAGMLAGRR